MTTIATTAGAARATTPSPWRAALARFAERVQRWRDEREALRIDRHYRRERNEQERYLSGARDVYELERREREWQRRHLDLWRVY